jgi:hypothetical protein
LFDPKKNDWISKPTRYVIPRPFSLCSDKLFFLPDSKRRVHKTTKREDILAHGERLKSPGEGGLLKSGVK